MSERREHLGPLRARAERPEASCLADVNRAERAADLVGNGVGWRRFVVFPDGAVLAKEHGRT